MHPYYPNGWNRQFVYPRMGFDEFISLDDFVNPQLMRGLVTDLCDYQKITDLIEQKEEGEKLFIFNVTIQNHSQYKTVGFPSTVEVYGYDGTYKSQAEQYETLISISNDALKYLIDYFSESDEKTLICFWGDHQPSVSDDYMTYLLGKDQETASFEEQQMQYQTKYLIWANYDIPEMQGQMLSSNYLGSYLLSLTGLDQTDYNQYLLGMRNMIPALNAYGYYGTDGVQHQYDTEDVSPAQQQKIDEYKCLIYNELTQEKDRDASFYSLEDTSQ
jgi:phosphoglycerol transferase MdoB-like AlkP superfamily enzyme